MLQHPRPYDFQFLPRWSVLAYAEYCADAMHEVEDTAEVWTADKRIGVWSLDPEYRTAQGEWAELMEGEPLWVSLAYNDSLDGCWESYYNPATERTETEWITVSLELIAAWGLEFDTVGVSLEFSEQGFVSGTEYNASEWQQFTDRVAAVEQEDADNDKAVEALAFLKRIRDEAEAVADAIDADELAKEERNEWADIDSELVEHARGIAMVLERCLPDEWEALPF